MQIMLVGGGKLIYHLAKKLISKGHFLIIINKDAEYAREMARELKATVVNGDATIADILEDAGAYETDIMVSLTPKDEENLMICKMGKKYFGIERTTALVNNPENAELFSKLGIDSIFNTTELLSSLIEQNVVVEDISNLITIEEGKLSITQYVIPEESPAVGKTLKEIDLPLTIVLGGIIREGEIIIPRGSTEIKAADKILIISVPEEQSDAIQILGGE